MSGWVAGAVAVGSVGSALISSNAAGNAADAAKDASDAQIAFEREKYNDWNEVYGPLQDNLADYYSNVSPEYYASVGLETFQTEFDTSMQRLNENLAQRGIDPSSGIAASLGSQAELDAAESRAAIRRDAPRLAVEDQRQFLQIGLGQNPGSSMSSALSNQATLTAKNAAGQAQAVGQAWNAAIPAVGRAIDAYVNQPTTPPPNTLMAGNPTNPAYDLQPGQVLR